MSLSNMKIGTRMWFGFGSILVLLIFVSTMGYRGIDTYSKGVKAMRATEGVIAEHSARARANVLGMRRYEKDMILNHANPEKVKSYYEKWKEERDSTAARIAAVKAVAVHQDDIDGLETIANYFSVYQRTVDKLYEGIQSNQILTPEAGNKLMGTAKDEIHAFEKEVKDLATEGNLGMTKMNDTLDAKGDSILTTIWISALIAVLIGLFAANLITRGIRIPIGEAAKVVSKLAEGDLTVTMNARSTDEIGLLQADISTMAEKLTIIMSEVQSAVANVASGSHQLSATAQKLSQGATEQAANVEEVSSSMEEMASTIEQNTQNSKETEKNALQAADDATESGTTVGKTVEAMKQIANKIAIVEEIARQTNLLALNAAIEAARAGEAGKGFAVVASEVRKLAERSQTAANEISSLSSSSVEIAETAGSMLKKMVPDIQRTAQLVQEIAASSEEQNAGAEQVNRAVQQLDTVIQQNASSSEEMASTAEELSSQAVHLQEAISFFKLNESSKTFSRYQEPKGHRMLPAGSSMGFEG